MRKAIVKARNGSFIEVHGRDQAADFCIAIESACFDVLRASLTEAQMVDLHTVIGQMIFLPE